MNNLAASLLQDLQLIHGETRRKFPDIRVAADKAILIVTSLNKASFADSTTTLPQELAKSPDPLRPFLLSMQTGNARLIQLSVGCMHKLISHKAIPTSHVSDIINVLADALMMSTDIQLKILQTLLPLLSNYEDIHGDLLSEALVLCFRLQESKVVVVQNTAAATLRQVVMYLMDKVLKEDSSAPVSVESSSSSPESVKNAAFYQRYMEIVPEIAGLKPSAFDAYLLFQDLCLLTSEDAPMFVRLEHLNRSFGLELIEAVLGSHHKIFRQHFEFTVLLRDRVCPLLIKALSAKESFPVFVRVHRIVYTIIKNFADLLTTECEIFLSMFSDILLTAPFQWQKVLSIEILRGIFQEYKLLQTIYQYFDVDGSSRVFQELMTTLWRVASMRPDLLSIQRANTSQGPVSPSSAVEGLSVIGSTVKIQCIDQLDKDDPPAVPESYLIFLALKCFLHVSEGISYLVLPVFLTNSTCGSRTSAGSYSCSQPVMKSFSDVYVIRNDVDLVSETGRHPLAHDIKMAGSMVMAVGETICNALMFFVCGKIDADLLHDVLRAYQNIAITCGVLELHAEERRFIEGLCAYVMDSWASDSSHVKHTAGDTASRSWFVLRILINVGHALSDCMLAESWFSIISLLKLVEPDQWKANVPSKTETFVQLSRALNDLIEESYFWNDYALQCFIYGWTMVYLDSFGIKVPKEMVEKVGNLNASLTSLSTVQFEEHIQPGSPSSIGSPKSADFFRSWGIAMKEDETCLVVEKLLQVLVRNMHRFFLDGKSGVAYGSLWSLVVDYLVKLANYPCVMPVAKRQICDAVRDIILSTISSAENTAEFQNTHLFSENLQVNILRPLQELVSTKSKIEFALATDSVIAKFCQPLSTALQIGLAHQQVQIFGLEIVQKLLQMCGEKLSGTGYAIVFRIFEEVSHAPTSLNADGPVKPREFASLTLIRIAFPSLQLICTDFLTALHGDNLLKCIETIGLFAAQAEDMNISLTSIGLLWTLCDTVRALIQDSETSNNRQYENRLIEAILHQLKRLIVDGRNEIRNTALQTIFRAIMLTFGPLFDRERWQYVLDDIIVPVLTSVRDAARAVRGEQFDVSIVTVDDENTAATFDIIQALFANSNSAPLSPADSASVGIRQNLLKQWNETLVLTINSVAQLISSFLDPISALDSFSKGSASVWDSLLAIVANEFTGVDMEIDSSQFIIHHQHHDCSYAAIKAFKLMVNSVKDLALSKNVDDRVYIMMRRAWQHYVRISDNLKIRKHAVSWFIDRIEPMIHSPVRGTKVEMSYLEPLVDLILKPETLIVYVSSFYSIWEILKPSRAGCPPDCVWSISEFAQLLRSFRIVITYFDMSYYIPLPESIKVKSELAHKLGYGRSAVSMSYFSHSFDVDELSFSQDFILRLILSSTFLNDIKEAEKMQKKPYLPVGVERDDSDDFEKPLWVPLQDLSYKASALLLEELATWACLAYRVPFVSTEGTSPAGNRPFLCVSSPAAMCRSLSKLQFDPDGNLRIAKEVQHSKSSNLDVDFINTTLSRECPLLNSSFRQDCIELPPPTYVAFSKVCYRAIVKLFCDGNQQFKKLSMSKELYTEGTINSVLLSLEIPMVLKYDCINLTAPPLRVAETFMTKSVDLWKIANDCFLIMVGEALESSRRIFVVPDKENYKFMDMLWFTIFRVSGATLSSKSLPPSDATLKEFRENEMFEIRFLSSFTTNILRLVGAQEAGSDHQSFLVCPDRPIVDFIGQLVQLSRLWNSNIHTSPTLLLNTLPSAAPRRSPLILPVVKERLAQNCLQSLIQLISEVQSSDSSIEASVKRRIAAITYPQVMQLFQSVIEGWIRDKPLAGGFPFPRVRETEMEEILRHMASLHVEPGIFGTSDTSAHLRLLYPYLCKLIPYVPTSDMALQKLGSPQADHSNSGSPWKKVYQDQPSIGDWLVQCLLRLDGTLGDNIATR